MYIKTGDIVLNSQVAARSNLCVNEQVNAPKSVPAHTLNHFATYKRNKKFYN